VIRERKDPQLVREDPIPQPVATHPDPTPTPISPEMPKPGAAAPDPRLVELVRIWQHLSPRHRTELLFIARMKAHLDREQG